MNPDLNSNSSVSSDKSRPAPLEVSALEHQSHLISRPAIRMFILEQFVSSTATFDLQQVNRLVGQICEHFSDEGLMKFASLSLGRFIGATEKLLLEPNQTMKLLEEFRANGSLEFTLPLLFEKLPQVPVAILSGRLSAINRQVGEAAPVVFQHTLPAAIERCGDKFAPDCLLAFQELGTVMKSHTPEAFQLLCQYFEDQRFAAYPLKLPVHLIERSGIELSSESAFGCFKFSCELIQILGVDDRVDSARIFGECSRLWREWGELDQVGLGGRVVEFIRALSPALTVSRLPELFAYLNEAGPARALLDGSTVIVEKKDVDLLIKHCGVLRPYLGIFPSSYARDLVEFMAVGQILSQQDTCIALLDRLAFKGVGLERVSLSLKFLKDAIQRLSPDDFANLGVDLEMNWDSWMDMLYPNAPVDDTAMNYLLGGVVLDIQSPGNPWPLTEQQFYERWSASINFQKTTAFQLDNVSVTIPVSPRGVTVRLRDNTALDEGFLVHRYQQFKPLPLEERLERIREIRDIVVPDGKYMKNPSVNHVFELLTMASRTFDRQQFVKLVEQSLPLLATACGSSLFNLTISEASPDEKFDFLDSLRALIDDGIVTVLKRHGMDYDAIDQIKRVASIAKIERELRKFEKRQPAEICRIDLETSKNVFDTFHDQMGKTCILADYASALSSPIFQPVRAYIGSEHRIVGCFYMLKAPVRGEESIIMAGGGLNREVSKSLDVREFYRLMIAAMKEAVSDLTLAGLYTAFGKSLEGETNIVRASEGRIGQTEEAIRAILPAFYEVIDLAPEEQIDFPPGYIHGKLARVVRL